MNLNKALCVVVALAVSACSTASIRTTEKLADQHESTAALAVKGGQRSAKAAAMDALKVVEVNQGVWLGGQLVKTQPHEKLPATLGKVITMNEQFATLTALTEKIQADIGMPVRLSPEVSPYPSSAASGGSIGGLPGMPAVGGMGGGSPGGMSLPGGMSGMRGGSGTLPPVHIAYAGPASGLLDVVAARFGTHWRVQGGGILFYNLETKTFELDAIASDATLAANVTGGGANSAGGSGTPAGAPSGSGVSSGGGTSTAGGLGGAPAAGGSSGGASGGSSGGDTSGSTTVVNATLSIWSDIKSAVNSMLSRNGKAVVTPSTGTVTVTDDPVYVDRIEDYIDQENVQLSRQVLIDVKVLSVSIDDADQYGINWNAVFNSLSKNVGMTATNTFAAGPGVGSLAMNVLSSAGGSTLKQFAGSSAVIDALSTQGKVSQLTSATVVTLNNQPVPIQVGTQTSYLAYSTSTLTANVGSQSALVPGMVQTGFNMNLLPHLLSDRTVMLQFSVNISNLVSLNTISSGGSTMQNPVVDSRDFLQRVSMRSGETLLLSGFEQTNGSVNKQGIGSASNVALGGGVAASRKKDIVVILITPVVGGKR